MELKYYLSILARRWQIILLVALVASLAFILGDKYIPPNYQTVATLQVITPLAGSFGDTYHETTFANRLINTYGQIATSDQVMSELKEKLGLAKLPDISVKIIPDSEIIKITVEGEDPALIAQTANGLADLIMAKQNKAATDNANLEELNILTERQNVLEKELAQATQDLDRLIPVSSQATADLEVLNRTIQLKQTSYQTLLQQYQQNLAASASSPSARSASAILKEQLDQLEKELVPLNQEYKDLSTKTNEYSQQILMLRQTIQNDQTAYSDIRYRYESTLGASLRQQRTQDIILVSPAMQPVKPTGIHGVLIIGLGVILGCLAGVVVAFFYENLDTRIISAEQVSKITTAPVLGNLPDISFHKGITVSGLYESLAVYKDYWMLCTRLLSIIQDRPLRTILVTSPNPMDGKSIVTSALALGLASNNCKVLIVDADLRKPQQQKLYQTSSEQGLDTFLKDGKSKAVDVIQKNVKPGIDILPCSESYSDPTDLLQHSSRFDVLLKSINSYDVVLFDAPALLVVPDAYALSKMLDGVIIIVKAGQTTSEDLRYTCDHLDAIGTKLAGVIMNRVSMKEASDYYHRRMGWSEYFIHLREKLGMRRLKHTERYTQK